MSPKAVKISSQGGPVFALAVSGTVPPPDGSRVQVSCSAIDDPASQAAIVAAGAEICEGAVVGDQAHVRERSSIGPGAVIGRGTGVEHDVAVGAGTKVQSNCYLAARTEVEADVFIGPGAVTANDDTMGRHPPERPSRGPLLRRGCRIGAGAVIRPEVEIGADAFVAAGAVVVADVPAGAVVMGVPARQVREVPDEDRVSPPGPG